MIDPHREGIDARFPATTKRRLEAFAMRNENGQHRSSVACEVRGHDGYKRSIVCADLVVRIWAPLWLAPAWPGRSRYRSDYISQENAAISARLGVHAHDYMRRGTGGGSRDKGRRRANGFRLVSLAAMHRDWPSAAWLSCREFCFQIVV